MPQSNLTFHRARKRFGQNFLRDDSVIQQIIRTINPQKSDNLVEIGPGQGALTEGLLNGAKTLHVVELDRDLIPALRLRFGLNPEFHIHEGDALTFDFGALKTDQRPLRCVGNLPYNISTPLIFHLLKFEGVITDMHFMLQKEVVQRLAAAPGDKNYGRLSIMTQYYCTVDYLFTVFPSAFTPAPKIDSAVVRLTPHKIRPYSCSNITRLENIVRDAFSQRRKTLRNTLKKHLSADKIEALGINAGLRPEQLHLADFIKIADYLEDSFK
ncbi:MAG: 16S rRNA (adenine(1518)-N(6)/adenine(1519)-N(6))-dimethyltransferase RsmA [Endozoicomonas sp. (ex Botrylloides leachii)]|nr:16S rRNA (adenine(1518)-N(6)/adenine(1519)-N(6))-dimethyltransferase RsmA [Endozoicomonas sp. (ex Botrylloides leachii)]